MNSYKKLNIAVMLAVILVPTAAWSACNPTAANRPVCPANASPETATFIDPTVSVTNATSISISTQSFIAPFAGLNVKGKTKIGHKTNLQDSVILSGRGDITLGDEVILAHGAQVTAPAIIGRTAVAGAHNASFVGFNSLIQGAKIQHDAMVLHLARVAPGITIKTGKVVLSGKNITTQAQADNLTLGKVVAISQALREFMEGVLHVNETFARSYTKLYHDDTSNVTGINYDPADDGASPAFNPTRNLPVLAGVETRLPSYRNRIIGEVEMGDSAAVVSGYNVFGNQISLRADEGEPFHLGTVHLMGNRTTFHALEHTGLDLHDDITFGMRSLVHGGSSVATQGNPHSNTVIGEHTMIGNYAVVFRSVLGNDVTIGCASLVDGATLADDTVVLPRTVIVGTTQSVVEWNPGCGMMNNE